jgi:methylenetetrahydrofolate reductase (NADPH)
VSFRAWREEAFSIWQEWQRIYSPRSPTAELLKKVAETYWLVNIVHHEYMEPDALWELLFA